MISSRSDVMLIIFSVVSIYFGLVTGQTYLIYGMSFMALSFLVSFFRDKKCENNTLDAISKLYAQDKQIDIQELSNTRNCKFTQNDLKFFNYYKRKAVIPFDAELIDPNNYSSHTFE
jgi:hypothetical protein